MATRMKPKNLPSISLRLDLEGGRLGPGKAALLERIEQCGSIAAAGRSLGMSYRRAWSLVTELNAIFGRPLVETQHGGKTGGGAALTDLGRRVVGHYRDAERASAEASRSSLEALQAEIDRAEDQGPEARPRDSSE